MPSYKNGDRVKVKLGNGTFATGEVRSAFVTPTEVELVIWLDDGHLIRCVRAEDVSLVSD